MSLQEYFNYNINFNTSNSLILGQATVASIFTPGSGMLTHTVNTIGNMFMTGGNVGIGTTSPAAKLDVNGPIMVSNYQETIGINAYWNGSSWSRKNTSAPGFVFDNNTTNTTFTKINTSGSAINALSIQNNGFIGISNLNPSYTLDVTGSVRITSGNLLATFNSNTIGNIITTGGNVGIGTVAPTYTLDVSGTGRFTNILSTTSTMTNLNITDTTVAYGFSSAASIISAGGAAFRNMWLAGAAGSSTGSTPNQFTPLVLGWNSGNPQIVFQRGDGGANTVQLGVNTQAQFSIVNNSGVSSGGLLFQTGSARPIYFTGGNVGIGTSNPSSALDVVGNILSTGSIDAGTQFLGQALDSSTGPSFSWTGDTNTGIYRPLADTLGFVTNSTEIIRVTSSGNVGIGTTAPAYKLDINGSLRGVGSSAVNYSAPHVLQNTASITNPAVLTLLAPNLPTSGSTNFFMGRDLSNNNACDIQYVYVSTGSTQNAMQLGFYGQAAPYNLTLLANGNVGIGTTNPNAKLHLNTTPTAASYGIWNGSATLSANQQLLQFIGKDNALRNGFWNWYSHVGDNNTSNNLRWDANGMNSVLSLSAVGRVGILTTNQAYTLDVNGTIRSTGDIFVGDGTNAEALNLWDVPGAAWQLASGSWNLNIRNGTVGSTMVDRVTISSTGNVGIGTTTPLGKISVDYSGISTNQNVLSLHTSNTGTTDYNLIEAGHGASSTFVLKGNGNVGIGTTSPSEKLHINGNILLGPSTADSNVDYTISTPGQLTINANNASTQDNTFVALTLTAGISSNQSNIILCGSASNSFRHIAFSTMNTERMRLSSAGNLGIGTSTPAYPLDIINTVGSSNQPFMRIGNSTGGAGNQVGIILAPFTPRTGGASSQIISIDDGNASAHLTLWTAPAGTGSASVERVRIQNNGNVGIGTASPAFTLDVNGTIARSGVKLPRYDNGSFSGAASFSIPILFNDTQYNYAEFRVRYVTSAICNINISATSYVNAAMNFGECALTTVKWNAQNVPVYATFSGVTSGIFADTVETVGIDNNLIFRIVRATGTSSTGLRNHYSYDNVYCWSGVGTARGYGQGHIDNASVGGSPLQFVTFTCSTGTVSGTYSSVHYY